MDLTGREHTNACFGCPGFFELSSNRRDIWHGKGMAGIGQLRSDWNTCLLKARPCSSLLLQKTTCCSGSNHFTNCSCTVQDVAAPAYAQLLAESARKLGPVPAFYQLWPVQQSIREPWSILATALWKEVAAHAVVHTAAQGGRWITPAEAVYVDAVVQRCASHLGMICSRILTYQVLTHPLDSPNSMYSS